MPGQGHRYFYRWAVAGRSGMSVTARRSAFFEQALEVRYEPQVRLADQPLDERGHQDGRPQRRDLDAASSPRERVTLHALAILDEEGLVITKRGKPVAKLIRIRAASAELIGALKDKVKINGDILSTSNDWHAQS